MSGGAGAGGGAGVRRFDPGHFDALYRRDRDPWQVRSSWYERRKLALLLAVLGQEHYGAALELGCSVGGTTEHLTARCDRLLAVDGSPVALDLARAHLAVPMGSGRVELARVDLPDELGGVGGGWDLVVLSEVGYFLEPEALRRLAVALPDLLGAGGELVAVHWRHGTDLPVRGDDVHAVLRDAALGAGLAHAVTHAEDDVLVDTWVRRA